MGEMTHQDNINQLIAMENRIAKCKRCASKSRCLSKPSLGKGDLKPELLMVFQSAGCRHQEINNYMEIRQMLKKELALERIYHTFLVRCQPKVCLHIDNIGGIVSNNSAYFGNTCPFDLPECEGVSIVPTDENITFCLPYLLEEIDILAPGTIILFGKRTAEYGLKAVGILEEPSMPGFYEISGRRIYTTKEENIFTVEDAKKLADFTRVMQADLA